MLAQANPLPPMTPKPLAGLAFPACHGKECGGFLFHILAPALRALDVFVVLLQGQDQFEGFVAIVTDVVVHGHGRPPVRIAKELQKGL